MKKLFVAIIIIFSCHSLLAQQKEKLDSLMNYYTTEFYFNGVVLVTSHGKTLYDNSFGYRDVEKKIKHDKNSIFQLGTLTQPFTAEVILQLAQEKKLNLEDKLSKYLPGYPSGDSITIANLLSHTSGIYNYALSEGVLDKYDTTHVAKDSVLKMFKNARLGGTPGKVFAYSNSNYFLLGLVIEQVTHASYEKAVRERIFKPAGMTHSGFDYRGLKSKDKSKGYRTYNEEKTKNIPLTDSTINFSASGMYSTEEDLNNFHNALQTHKLLSKEWQDKAYDGGKNKFGYGWYTDNLYNRQIVTHGGFIKGFANYMMRVKQDDVCIIILQNHQFPPVDNNTFAHSILACMYDTAYKVPPMYPEVNVSTDSLEKFTGDYHALNGLDMKVFVKANSLYAQASGQEAFKLAAIGPSTFRTRAVNATIDFYKESTGQKTRLIIHSKKADITATKRDAKRQ